MLDLQINGKNYQIEAEGEMPLLWAIRDIIGLTGTKFGCGVGSCGACKVLIGDKAVFSCLTPVSAVTGKEISTIESNSEILELLRKSWAELNVPQCGYCQPGQLISATALLNSNKNPSDAEIDEAMSENICRCGVYQRIKKAIQLTAKQLNK